MPIFLSKHDAQEINCPQMSYATLELFKTRLRSLLEWPYQPTIVFNQHWSMSLHAQYLAIIYFPLFLSRSNHWIMLNHSMCCIFDCVSKLGDPETMAMRLCAMCIRGSGWNINLNLSPGPGYWIWGPVCCRLRWSPGPGKNTIKFV